MSDYDSLRTTGPRSAHEINQRVRQMSRESRHLRNLKPLGEGRDSPSSGGGLLIRLLVGWQITGSVSIVLASKGVIPWWLTFIPLIPLIPLGVLGLGMAVVEVLKKRATRGVLQRLLTADTLSSQRAWELPAPETYALLRDLKGDKADVFKLGLIQLISMGVLTPEGSGSNTVLRRGPVPASNLTGSLGHIYGLWASSAQHPVVENDAEEATL